MEVVCHVSLMYSGALGRRKSFPGGSVVKNLPANAGDARDAGSVPELGRSPEGENGNHSSILAWRIPWTEEPGGLQFMGLKESDMTE